MRRLDSIQILRFAAALLVVWCHGTVALHQLNIPALLAPASLYSAGAFGVDIFFVISGFIMARLTFAGDAIPKARRFFADRFTRIAPIYWWISVFPLAIAVSVGRFEWKALATTLTFWPAWGETTTPLLSVGWTLCFEMLFYLVLTLVLWSGRPRFGAAVVAGAFALVVVSRLTGANAVGAFLGNGMILEFVFGFAIGFLRFESRAWLGCFAIAAGSFFAILAASDYAREARPALQAMKGQGDFLRLARYGAPAAAIVWGTLQFAPKGPVARGFAYLGDTSYSLYLTHLLLIGIFMPLIGAFGRNGDAALVGYLVVCVLIGVLVHELAEKPLLKALRRPPRSPAPAVPAQLPA